MFSLQRKETTVTYSKHFSTTKTPDSRPIPGADQVANNAGGFAWKASDDAVLDRFLILGTEGGTYYVDEQPLTTQNAETIFAMILKDGERVVRRTVEISQSGRAARNEAAIFVLALCASLGSAATRKLALSHLPDVCRIPTHLFNFLSEVQHHRGWGRGLKTAVQRWYNDRELGQLTYHVVKYPARGDWTQRDVLRKAHPVAPDKVRNRLYRYITKGKVPKKLKDYPYLEGYLKAKACTTPDQVAGVIRDYGLTHEMVPKALLGNTVVWEALLEKMPIHALLRNLGNLSKYEVVAAGKWDSVQFVVDKLTDAEYLRRARVHPLQILQTMSIYALGYRPSQYRGYRYAIGSREWDSVPQVGEALQKAFYLSFDAVEPVGQRMVLGVDISGSMEYPLDRVAGLTCRQGAAVMAMVTARVEPKHALIGFTMRAIPLDIRPDQRLEDIEAYLRSIARMEGTACVSPIQYALKHEIEADAFVLYTDNETWGGDQHVSQALTQYRRQMGIHAKLVVVGMVANSVSVADPADPAQLNVVGFDTNTPAAINEFLKM